MNARNPFADPVVRSIVEAAQNEGHIAVDKILFDLTEEQILDAVMLLTMALDVDNPITPYAPNGVRKRIVCRVKDIARIAGAQEGVPLADIYSTRRHHSTVQARAITCAVAVWSGITMVDVGKCIERDHSTVSVTVAKVEANPDLLERARSVMFRVGAERGVST